MAASPGSTRSLGALRVGPASAGAVPGPACYGRGGTRPTVTDAAVVLGYVDRLGGALSIDAGAGAAAVDEHIARPLGLDLFGAADGILQVACEQMRDLIRRTTIQRGHDPADFVLYAFGGAGPQYAGRYAADLGVAEVIVPALAAEFSAFGAAASELKTTVEQDIAPGDLHSSLDRINSLFPRLEGAAREQLAPSQGAVVGLLGETPAVARTIGLRYYRQIHRIDLPAPPPPLQAADADRLLDAFRRRYELIVGRGTARLDTPVEVVTLGVEAVIPVPLVLPPSRPPVSRPLAGGGRRGSVATRAPVRSTTGMRWATGRR